MNLFDLSIDENANLLPKDGTVNYYGEILDQKQADHYFDVFLNNSPWQNDEVVIFGKKITTKRKVAWYGEKPFEYTYSKITRSALPWTKELLELKEIIEKKTGETFNACLLNLYHNGGEGMGWHSDAETDLEKNGAIASLSLGAERKFVFKHKRTKERRALTLAHGSLLVMKGNTQENWLHRLPPTKKIKDPRVNLTFRAIVENKHD